MVDKKMVVVYDCAELQYAYEAGWDCEINGANTENCHFSLFSSPEMTKAWEHGKKNAQILGS